MKPAADEDKMLRFEKMGQLQIINCRTCSQETWSGSVVIVDALMGEKKVIIANGDTNYSADTSNCGTPTFMYRFFTHSCSSPHPASIKGQ